MSAKATYKVKGWWLWISILLTFCAGAEQPEPLVKGQLKTVSATIKAISQSDRHLVLLDTNGNQVVVEAGPAVSNFDSVRPGDHVVVSYYEGMVAEVKPKGGGMSGPTATTAKTHPTGKGLPASAVASSVSTTVRVDSVDTSKHTVTFKRPDGVVRTLAVESPQSKQFIEQLKSGDEVQITYREASLVSIEPARG